MFPTARAVVSLGAQARYPGAASRLKATRRPFAGMMDRLSAVMAIDGSTRLELSRPAPGLPLQ